MKQNKCILDYNYQREYVVKLNKMWNEAVLYIKGKCKVDIYFEDCEIECENECDIEL